MDRSVDFRLPLPVRVYVVAFGLFACGMIAFGPTEEPEHRTAGILIAVGMLALLSAFVIRIFRIGVSITGDELLVRNFFRTRRLKRRDIEGFRVGSLPNMAGRTVFALLAGESILALEVFTRPGVLPSTRRRLAERVQVLRDWLAEEPDPTASG